MNNLYCYISFRVKKCFLPSEIPYNRPAESRFFFAAASALSDDAKSRRVTVPSKSPAAPVRFSL